MLFLHYAPSKTKPFNLFFSILFMAKDKLIAEGAEAQIFLSNFNGKNVITKQRVSKKYRAKELDDIILSKRIKAEANQLVRANRCGVKTPQVFRIEDKKIMMEYLDFPESKKVILENKVYIKNIAKNIVLLHKNDIIHGDLTLGNILFDPKKKEPYFIDFGLSFLSHKIEDKAMDLEVLRETIVADFGEGLWQEFAKEYAKQLPEIVKYMEKINARKKYL